MVFVHLIIFIIGAAVGSFINVVIFRLGKEGFLFERSYCPYCKKILSWYELIPIFSFVIQKGRCRFCQTKLSWQYPIVEIATGLIFVLSYYISFSSEPLSDFLYFSNHISQVISFVYLSFVLSLLFAIFVYDLRHMIIPDSFLVTGFLITFFYNTFLFLNSAENFWKYFYLPFASALLASGFFAVLFFVSKGKWIGFGDVRFGFWLGFLLSWPNILVALFFAYFIGAFIGIFLILLKKKTLASEIPFGPFLALGATIALFFGKIITSWYLNLL